MFKNLYAVFSCLSQLILKGNFQSPKCTQNVFSLYIDHSALSFLAYFLEEVEEGVSRKKGEKQEPQMRLQENFWLHLCN